MGDLVQSSHTVPGPDAYAHTSPRHVAGGSFSRTGHALDLVGTRGSIPGPGLYGAEGHHQRVTGGCLSHTGHNLDLVGSSGSTPGPGSHTPVEMSSHMPRVDFGTGHNLQLVQEE